MYRKMEKNDGRREKTEKLEHKFLFVIKYQAMKMYGG